MLGLNLPLNCPRASLLSSGADGALTTAECLQTVPSWGLHTNRNILCSLEYPLSLQSFSPKLLIPYFSKMPCLLLLRECSPSPTSCHPIKALFCPHPILPHCQVQWNRTIHSYPRLVLCFFPVYPGPLHWGFALSAVCTVSFQDVIPIRI